jgi:hypothetical protein
MGCDIHLYKEKKIGGSWVTADEWQEDKYEEGRKEVPYEKRFTDRNYNLFGVLAGVRQEYPFSLTPRGLPFNMSPEVKADAEMWDADGHSHSYLSLAELKDLRDFLQKEKLRIEGMKHKDEVAALHATLATDTPNYDLLYPYCKWGSSPDLIEFAVDIPASYIVGGALDRIIESFDGVEGEDQRIVFWFDN